MKAIAILAQLAVTMSAPDTVPAGESFTLTVRLTASGLRAPRLIAPDLAPLTVAGSEMSRTSQASGWLRRPWIDVEYKYRLRAHRPGTYTIPPFGARLDTARAESNSLTIVAVPPPPPASVPEIVASATIEPGAPVAFRAMVIPDTVWVGQQSTYQVAMFVDRELRAHLRRNPDFFAPEMRGLLAYELPLGRMASAPERRVGERRYEAHVYQRAVFPLAPGRLVIPPAQLVYSLAATPSFFSREETRELRTDTLVLVALEPPDAGRPPEYAGAVGTLSLSSRLDTNATRVGDPIRLTLAVRGAGNVKLFPRPAVDVGWAAVVPSGERVSVDTGASIVQGTKEFDWVLTPRIPGELELPAFSYPYFDPATARYEVARTAPDTVRVGPGTFVAADSARTDTAVAPLPIRVAFAGETGPPVHERGALWAVALAAPLPVLLLALGGVVARVRRRRLPARVRLRALARLKAPRSADLRRAWVDTLGERLGVGPETLTVSGGLERALRRAGVTPETASSSQRLSLELERAAYASGAIDTRDAAVRAHRLAAAIDREALDREDLGAGPRILAVLLVVAAAGAVHAASVDDAARSFSQGVSAYEQGAYRDAMASFARAAEDAPRSVDAWANYGTAAWMAGQTAPAVGGWQRAIRLDPLALDVRARLSTMRAWRIGRLAWVPPLSTLLLAVIALSLWVGGWALAAWRVQGDPWRRRWAYASIVAALVVSLGASGVDEIIAGRDLAVVRGRGVARELPALRATVVSAHETGDVVRITGRRGPWARVVGDASREGWIESARLIPIARP